MKKKARLAQLVKEGKLTEEEMAIEEQRLQQVSGCVTLYRHLILSGQLFLSLSLSTFRCISVIESVTKDRDLSLETIFL